MIIEPMIPNASMRLVGRASLSSSDGRRTTKAGSVLETNDGAAILWLHVYPLQGQDVDLSFDIGFGQSTHEVSVVTNYKTQKAEFIVGEVNFFGTKGKLRLFCLPVFQATFLLKANDRSKFHREDGPTAHLSASHPALRSVR